MSTSDILYAVLLAVYGLGGYAGLCLASYNEEEIKEFLKRRKRK